MQPVLKTAALALVILQYLPTALGGACTQSNAVLYKTGSDDGCSAADIARDDTGCVKQYCTQGGTAASLQTCFCLALNEGNCSPAAKHKRQTFSCSGSDKCYINPVDGGLFCLNESTGNYIGESGDSGNVDTGAYTAAASGTATAAVPGTSTSARGSSSTSSDSLPASQTVTRSSTGLSGSSTDAATAANSAATSALTSSTRSAGQAKVTAGAILGALGLAVGMIV